MWHCPYCYEAFAERDIIFRCTGLLSRGGKRCEPEVDPVLRDWTGYAGALPPVFPADARRPRADCPRCGAGSTIRVCPVCHSMLPVWFGEARSRLLALVGARQSGKTVYMTVLLHELMNKLGERLEASISGADDHTRHQFPRDYEKPLYGNSTLLPPTTPAAQRNRVPLVYRYTTSGRRLALGGRALAGRAGPRHTLFSFFDAAGEDLTTRESAEQNARYLAAADGIILILDPLQMPGARSRARPGTLLPAAGSADEEPVTVLANITDLIAARGGGLIGKPLAIVFAKIDALFDEFGQASALMQPQQDKPCLPERDSVAVHEEIQRLLARWDGPRIDQFARLHYRRYRYCAVSALGETPTRDNNVVARGIRPFRVADPLLWILAELGAIDTCRG